MCSYLAPGLLLMYVVCSTIVYIMCPYWSAKRGPSDIQGYVSQAHIVMWDTLHKAVVYIFEMYTLQAF